MALTLQIILFLVGLALIVFGADWLVDGASSVARKFGISEFVIGLTIVGMGTSAPEMVVSFLGAIQGNADIAVGNVFGSNIFNTLLILGVTAAIMPMPITRENLRRDIPLNLGVIILLVLLGATHRLTGFGDDILSRLDGGILLAIFLVYMFFSFKNGKKAAEVARQIPIEYLLSETDAPYLAPEPFRGRPNKSPYITHVVRRMALLKGIEYEEAAAILTENGKRFFGI